MTLCAIACALLFYVIAAAEIPWQAQLVIMWVGALGWAMTMWHESDGVEKDDVG